MRINYFSPIITSQSGIAELAMQVVPSLSRYADVTLWTEEVPPARSPLAPYAAIRQFSQPVLDELRQDQAANIYHLGNDANWHQWIWQVYQRVPGVVVLHDLNLHHVFHKITCDADPSGEDYVAELRRSYGYGAGLMARRLLLAEMPLNQMAIYGMAEWALSQATGVLVHTRTGFATLSQHDRWPVVYQALAFNAAPPGPLPPRQPPYRLILFGHMNYNRRIESILQALATLPERSRFQLDIYGRLDHQAEVEGCIQDWGLNQQVTMHGFVADEVLDRALAEAHLAINLRYPTMGEASFSQLRIWQHRLPALVTQVGWYAEQPENVVCFVRPESEIEDIQQHLQAFIQWPDRFEQMGERGYQRLLALHQPDAYAQALVQLCQQQDLGYQALTTQYYLQRSAAILADWGKDLPVEQLTNAIHWLTARESV